MKLDKIKTDYCTRANVEMAKILIKLLNERDVSQRYLAKAIKVSTNRINQILQGKWSVTIDTDLRLCKFFNKEDGFFIKQLVELQLKHAKENLNTQLEKIIPEKAPSREL
ncbi:MAG: HigA family addiction module antitoxin [Alphaproteobacteria bacterium]